VKYDKLQQQGVDTLLDIELATGGATKNQMAEVLNE